MYAQLVCEYFIESVEQVDDVDRTDIALLVDESEVENFESFIEEYDML